MNGEASYCDFAPQNGISWKEVDRDEITSDLCYTQRMTIVRYILCLWQFLAVKLKNGGTLNVVHLKTSNENSGGAAGSLQHFACEKACVRWKIIYQRQGHGGAFGYFKTGKFKQEWSCPYVSAVHHFRHDLAVIKIEGSS